MQTTIRITNDIIIPKGNAAYIYEIMRQGESVIARDTFAKFLQAESYQRTNPRYCYSLLRQLLENVAYDVTACHMRDAGISADSYENIWDRLKEASQKPGNASMCKRLIEDAVHRFDNNPENKAKRQSADKILGQHLKKFRKKFLPERRYLKAVDFGREIYGEACKGNHTEDEAFFRKEETWEKAVIMTESVFYLTQFLKTGKADHEYILGLAPLNGYYPVRPVLYKEISLENYIDYDFYVRETDAGVRWYILKEVREEDPPSARDAQALSRLWNMNRNTPSAILRPIEKIALADGQMQVYAIFGTPQAFSEETFAELSFAERAQIALGLADGIASLHRAQPPMPHRCLSPHEILICRQRDIISPVIIGFRSVKDAAPDAGTVLGTLLHRGDQSLERPFLAPEIFGESKENLTKADIYSFGKLLGVIFKKELTRDDRFSRELKRLMADMTCIPDAEARPEITEVQQYLTCLLQKEAVCAAYTHIGERDKQQDAFYIGGGEPVFKENLCMVMRPADPVLLVVFDGIAMAEETETVVKETAAYLHSLYIEHDGWSGKEPAAKMKRLAELLEAFVQQYKKKHGLYTVGTTIAAAAVDGKKAAIMNLGDSRIYLSRGDQMTLLTKDHRINLPGHRKQELYQFLGASEPHMALEPYIYETELKQGDRILLCTDGLSDLMDEQEISRIIRTSSVEKAAEKLNASAEAKGLRDNMTFLLYGYQDRFR